MRPHAGVPQPSVHAPAPRQLAVAALVLPTPCHCLFTPPLPSQNVVIMTGQLFVPSDDQVVFTLRYVDDQARVFVDGLLVVAAYIGPQDSLVLPLSAGYHDLRIEFINSEFGGEGRAGGCGGGLTHPRAR